MQKNLISDQNRPNGEIQCFYIKNHLILIVKYYIISKDLTKYDFITFLYKHSFLKTQVHKLWGYFIYSRSIQVGPMKPAVQTHLNFSTSLKHLAPFLQGSSPQGFAKKQKRPQYSWHCFLIISNRKYFFGKTSLPFYYLFTSTFENNKREIFFAHNIYTINKLSIYRSNSLK